MNLLANILFSEAAEIINTNSSHKMRGNSSSSVDRDLRSHVLVGNCSNYIKTLSIFFDHLYRHLT